MFQQHAMMIVQKKIEGIEEKIKQGHDAIIVITIGRTI